MKYFLFLIICISQYSLADFRTMYTPYELESISIEYSEISKKGIARVVGCGTCGSNTYAFEESVIILKNGKDIPLNIFLKEYWKAKYPTIFLDRKSNTIFKIRY